jgi:hypothetical protein
MRFGGLGEESASGAEVSNVVEVVCHDVRCIERTQDGKEVRLCSGRNT